MLNAITVLISAQLLGELLKNLLHLTLPGPVIGMFILAAVLLLRRRAPAGQDSALTDVSETLIGNMGLLFVPAGVGIVTESDVLREYWLPIVISLFGSTLLGLLVTALVMHHASLPMSPTATSQETK